MSVVRPNFGQSTTAMWGRHVAAGQRNRPAWQTEDCPPWCAREHLESDHPEDRIHQTEPLTVPALRRRSLLPEDRPERTEIEVMLAARINDNTPLWILIGEGEGPALLIVDEITALRLIDSLGELLPEKRRRRSMPGAPSS
jgi:hypothetical protein